MQPLCSIDYFIPGDKRMSLNRVRIGCVGASAVPVMTSSTEGRVPCTKVFATSGYNSRCTAGEMQWVIRVPCEEGRNRDPKHAGSGRWCLMKATVQRDVSCLARTLGTASRALPRR